MSCETPPAGADRLPELGTPALGSASLLAHNLRRLMARDGLTYDELVDASGLDARTIRGIIRGDKQPHARTLQRLADALGVSTEEFFQGPGDLSAEAFDAATNPLVAQAIQHEPQRFAGWRWEDFAELTSRFGVGGALTAAGVRAQSDQINHRRELLRHLRIVLESREAPLLESLIELLYERVTGDLANRQCVEQKQELGKLHKGA
ncbi:MAG: helix-turn-helix transcriptional regulator [Planctomycetales bacterium]|nr:helix-turn-helix transcriptional regulator [Planctomycetales bacterium]